MNSNKEYVYRDIKKYPFVSDLTKKGMEYFTLHMLYMKEVKDKMLRDKMRLLSDHRYFMRRTGRDSQWVHEELDKIADELDSVNESMAIVRNAEKECLASLSSNLPCMHVMEEIEDE